tara:strand:+ start:984 stop:1928 length:945 start_codon:yes stop_codon:yes gene_type:complete
MDKRRGINIDLSNKCTLECPKCLRQTLRQEGLRIPGEDMSIETFKKLLKYYDGGVVFCGQLSDPIFNDNLIEMLKLTRDRPWVHINTAATFKKRKKDWYEKAFKANLNAQWTFGIDGLPHQSFIYRIGQDGEKLFEMMKLGVECGAKVLWQYIIFKYNENYIDEAKELAKKHNIPFELNYSGRWNKERDYDPYRPSLKNRLVSKHDRELLARKFIPKCIEGKIPVAISATQSLLPCCWIDKQAGWADPILKKFFSDKLNLKNVESVEDIMKTGTWQEFFSLLINNPESVPDLCKHHCTSYVDENPNRIRVIQND